MTTLPCSPCGTVGGRGTYRYPCALRSSFPCELDHLSVLLPCIRFVVSVGETRSPAHTARKAVPFFLAFFPRYLPGYHRLISQLMKASDQALPDRLEFNQSNVRRHGGVAIIRIRVFRCKAQPGFNWSHCAERIILAH